MPHPHAPSPGGRRLRGALPAMAIAAVLIVPASAAAASTPPAVPAGYAASLFASAPAGATGADDIARLDGHNFVVWNNGVPKTGCVGNTPPCNSTVTEFADDGSLLNTWSVRGHADGVGGDAANHRVIVTVNEDGNSALYTIKPSAPAVSQVTTYTYNATDNGLTNSGTDAVAVDPAGNILISHSNPDQANDTAVYKASLSGTTATLTPTFADNATATNGLTGNPVTLALTDPDSNAVVPWSSPLYAGQFMLDSQADQQLVFADNITGSPSLTQLPLNQGGTPAGVDDVQWSDGDGGTLYVVDSGTGSIWAVTGPFVPGQSFASLDTVGAAAHTTEVDRLNLSTGTLTSFITGLTTSKGLLWVPGGQGPAGPTGPGGNNGGNGSNGSNGTNGSQGPPGAQGAQGPAGAAGPAGPTGPTGKRGPAGKAVHLTCTVKKGKVTCKVVKAARRARRARHVKHASHRATKRRHQPALRRH